MPGGPPTQTGDDCVQSYDATMQIANVDLLAVINNPSSSQADRDAAYATWASRAASAKATLESCLRNKGLIT